MTRKKRPKEKHRYQPSPPPQEQPRRRLSFNWVWQGRKYPALLLHFFLGSFCIAWLLLGHSRDWVELEATLCSRDVFRESSVEDGITSYEYFANFEYCYGRQGQVFVGNFQEERGHDQRVLGSLEEAVREAQRRQVGDSIGVVVDRQNPSVSAKQRPGGLFWPLLGVTAYVIVFALLISEAPLILVVSGPLLLLLVSQKANLPKAEELPLECNPELYLKTLHPYPTRSYRPQKQVRKFASLENLLRVWGRPDSLSLEQDTRGPTLHLLYRNGSEWKESWEFVFAIHKDGPPTPISAPQKSES